VSAGYVFGSASAVLISVTARFDMLCASGSNCLRICVTIVVATFSEIHKYVPLSICIVFLFNSCLCQSCFLFIELAFATVWVSEAQVNIRMIC
jgi:hypothetical protein